MLILGDQACLVDMVGQTGLRPEIEAGDSEALWVGTADPEQTLQIVVGQDGGGGGAQVFFGDIERVVAFEARRPPSTTVGSSPMTRRCSLGR